MTFRFFLAAFCLLTLTANAQRNPELIHSGEEIDKGIEAHDEGNYQEALEHYKKVHPADTNYLTALYEMSLTYLEMEDYEKVVELCEKGIAMDYHEPEIYNTYGSALDYQDKGEEALEIYDRGLEKFPYSMSLLFNKALVYDNMDNRKKTIEELQKIVEFNPFHASSQIQLGMMASEEGELTQAIIPLIVALAIEPGSGRSFAILSYADQIASGGADDIGSNDQNTIDPEFEELDLIVKNRLAINDKYETSSDLEFPIVKQSHLIMSQLQKGDAKSDGFWGSQYTEILSWIMEEDKFEEFSLLISLSVDDQYVQDLIKKNIDDIRDFRNEFLAKLRDIHGDYEIMHEGEKLAVQKWFHDDFSLQAFGAEDNTGQNDGPWKYYYTTGQIETIGAFTHGDRDGEWVSFNHRGDTSQVHNFENRKLNGTYKLFHENGLLSEMGTYKNGELSGELKGYYDTGQLRATLLFEDGERNGPVKYFYKTGELEQEMTMVDNELEGEMIEYYPNGQVSAITNFKEGVKEGVAEVYFPDGTLKQKTIFKDDLLEGPYVTYFQNGQVKSSGNTTDGSVAGEWKYFYMDGSLEKTSDFSENGKINGESISYDMEENPFQIEEFKQGELQRITFLNADGTEISSTKEKRGKLSTKFYNYRREVISEGTYEEGEREGLWKFYENGKLEEEENYLDGDLHGSNTAYFPNGKVSYIRNFEDGEANGYYVSNYRTDTIYAEGNYYEDNRECTWYYYYPNGVMKNDNWFEKGEPKGEQIGYSVVGLPETITLYDEPGMLSGYISFDTEGNPIDTVRLKNGTGKFFLKGASGKDYFQGEYLGGEAHGLFQWLYPDGSVEVAGNYQHDERTGIWNYYHSNGKLEQQGEYVKGERHGTWKNYNFFGELESEVNYFHGDLHGESIYHYPNGKKRSVTNYEYGERQGPMTFYTPDGTIIIQRIYDRGKMTAYTYLGENEELVEPIPVENETGKIEAYYPNGNKSAEYEMVRDWFEGSYKLFYEDGSILKEAEYKDDETVGTDYYYFQDGTTWKLTENEFGEAHGVEKIFYPNGELKSEINYVLGVMHGISKYFNEAGETLDEVTFYDGDPVKM